MFAQLLVDGLQANVFRFERRVALAHECVRGLQRLRRFGDFVRQHVDALFELMRVLLLRLMIRDVLRDLFATGHELRFELRDRRVAVGFLGVARARDRCRA